MTSSIKMPSTKKAMNALSKKRPPSIELNPASSQEVACCLHPTAGIMMTKQQSASRTKHAANTNTLLLQTIFNHASWSTLHVAARYLQVYAHPLVFDGQGVLSSAKGFAALFLFLLGIISSWVDRTCCCRSGDSSLPAAFAGGSESVTACDANKKDENKNNGVQTRSAGDYGSLSADKQLQQEIPSSKELNTSVSNPTENEVDAQNDELQSTEKSMQFRRKVFYTLLFAFVSTCRASLNIASAKYTYPYNISECNDHNATNIFD